MICTAIVTIQLYLLKAGGGSRSGRCWEPMTGEPSVWPLITVASYSFGAALLLGAGIAAAVWRLARGRSIPDFMLLMVLGVGAIAPDRLVQVVGARCAIQRCRHFRCFLLGLPLLNG